jgi:outer membrane protein assembly factor BamB
MLFGPTVGPDGTIYQGSWDGYIYAIKPTGKLKWKYLTAGAVSYPPSIGKNGIIYVGGGDAHAGPDSYLYALKPNGDLKWKYDTEITRVGSPAIGFDELIYAPAAPALFAFTKAGELSWSAGPNTGGSDDGSGDDSSDDNTPPGGDDGEQINGAVGTITADDDDVAGIITPAIGKDGRIYLGNSQGVVLAIDPTSHETLWTYQTGAAADDATSYGLPSFPVVDKRGRVYIGAVDGLVYAFSKTGDLLWTYQTGAAIAEAAAALGPDGTLYISSDDGYLYAIND